MKSLRRFFNRVVNVVTRRAQEERLREEIEEHIALQTAENLRAGLSPGEARRQAMLKFGGVEALKQDYRAERGLLLIENLLADLRTATRTISRMPGLAAVIIVSLAIGIGVNTTIFSWIQLILFEPMPAVSGAANFLLVEPRREMGGYPGASWLEYRDLQTQIPALHDIVASQMVPFNVGERGQTERTHGQLVSGNYFSALDLKPAIGRFIRPEEAERPGTEPVVVISYDYWQTRFRGAPEAVGQKLRVNRSEDHTSELQSHSDLVCRLLLEKKKAQVMREPLIAPIARAVDRFVRVGSGDVVPPRPLQERAPIPRQPRTYVLGRLPAVPAGSE